jgi:hypothetical protein
MRARPLAFAALGVPVLAWFGLLAALWFDAPIWDDYDTILRSANRMHDAASAREWWALLLAQHNEHRIVVMRLVTQLSILLTGGVDFRAMMFVGNLAVVGIFVVAWHAYRDSATPWVLVAAAFVQFQWSYYEAILMGSAAVPNLGVLFFSLAGLAFALRPGRAAAIASVVLGLLAAASQSNGLLAWPLAAAAAFTAGFRRRALVLGMLSIGLWAAHLATFVPPPNHPSILSAFSQPLTAIQLFFIMVGSIWPAPRGAALIGGAIVLAIVVLGFRGGWRRNPLGTWLVAFLLLSIAAAATVRTGLGVHHASRYAIYSSTLLVLLLFEVHALTAPWDRVRSALAVAAGVGICVVASWLAWPQVLERSTRGGLLSRLPPSVPDAPRYAGIVFPHDGYATEVLDRSAQLGYYVPPMREDEPARVTAGLLAQPPAALGGHLDGVTRAGNRLVVEGWSALPASLARRQFRVAPADGLVASRVIAKPRGDVAVHLHDPALLLTGFRLELEFAAAEAAALAQGALCVTVEAPGRKPLRIARPGLACPGD